MLDDDGSGNGGGEQEPLWNDGDFVRRVGVLAAGRGKNVRSVCKQAGLAADYLNKPAGRAGRSIEALLRISQVLGVSLAELVGVGGSAEGGRDADVTIKRLALVADIAAHLYVALSARSVAPQGAEKLVNEILQMASRAA